MYELVQKQSLSDFEYRRYFANEDISDKLADRYLTVVLHGHTGDLDLWHERCLKIRDAIPNNTVIAVQAPFISKKEGYTWLDFGKPLTLAKDLVKQFFGVAPIFNQLSKFVDKKAEEYGIEKENIALVGHSMGGVMALQTAFNSRSRYGIVFGLAAALPPFVKIKSKTDVFLTIGSEDEVFVKTNVPELGKLNAVFNRFVKGFGLEYNTTVNRLRKHGINLVNKVYEGEGHYFSEQMLEDGINYLADKLTCKSLINKQKNTINLQS